MSARLKASSSSESGNRNLPGVYAKVPGAGFEPATSGPFSFWSSPDYESGAQTRLGYPGYFLDGSITSLFALPKKH